MALLRIEYVLLTTNGWSVGMVYVPTKKESIQIIEKHKNLNTLKKIL